MHLFEMRGSWGRTTGWLYERVVGAGVGELYDRFVDEAIELADIDQGLVIDVGCGQGQVSGRLAQRLPGCQVIGFDLSAPMLERARERAPALDNLELRRADAMQLPLGDDTVDLAVSVASIKHWPDRERGVAQILRVLRPGGHLYLLEVDRHCSSEATRKFVDSWRHLAPGTALVEAAYFRRFVAGGSLDLDEIAAMVSRAGGRELEVWRLPELPFVVARALSAERSPRRARLRPAPGHDRDRPGRQALPRPSSRCPR